jgi:hypothetical protein
MNFYRHRIFFFLFCCTSFSPSLIAADPVSSSSDIAMLNTATAAIAKNASVTVENPAGLPEEETNESEKILVVLMDSYGIQNYSKIVITDVDMELSILIAKDIFNKLPGGIYTIIASSANDLISQKLIIR